MNIHSTFLLSLLALLPLLAPAAGTATVRVTNSGVVPITVAGQTIRPFATATIAVPAGEAGAFAATAPDGYVLSSPTSYPPLRTGGTYLLRLSAERGASATVPVPVAPAVPAGTIPVPQRPHAVPAGTIPVPPVAPAVPGTVPVPPRAPAAATTISPHPGIPGDDGLPEKTLVELRLALSDGLENAIGRLASVSPSEATNRVARMTCAMPAEYRGFLRDFIRFSQCWTERMEGEGHIVCLYNPWSDGALLFPIRNLGTTPEMPATPVVLAGETLRGGSPISESPPSLVPSDGDVAGDVFERTKRTRNGFRELARGGDWKEPVSFELKDGSFRQGQLKAVFSRILLLLEEQSAAVVLEATKNVAAIRYGDFLETMMAGYDATSLFDSSGAAEWNRLPEAFRRSLWPVRIVPYADELLVVLQSPAFPGTALFVEFPDDPENRSASLSFLDFDPEQ